MKIEIKYRTFCLAVIGAVLLCACKKDEEILTGISIAKVNVVNAVVGGGGVKANVSDKKMYWINNSVSLPYGSSKLYVSVAGQKTFLKVVPTNDTTNLWYDKITNLEAGRMYSMYLSGTPTKIDTMLRLESDLSLPSLDIGRKLTSVDSVINLRFINLSSTGPKIIINVSGSDEKETSPLGYQEYSAFKRYPLPYNVNSISFEIRNSNDNSLLLRFNYNASVYRFRNVTIAIIGQYIAPPGLPVAGVNAYMPIQIPYL